MKPLVELLPFIISDLVAPSATVDPLPKKWTFERVVDLYPNERTSDCGPVSVKFIELHAQGMGLDVITDQVVDEFRMKYATDVYQSFVVSLS